MDTNNVKLRTGDIIISCEKIGIVNDVFTNEHGDVKFEFESAESIIRSPIRPIDTEFIPLIAHATRHTSLESVVEDVRKKKDKIEITYENIINSSLEMFRNYDGDFVKSAYGGASESFILRFENDHRILLESVMGEMLFYFNPRMWKKIGKAEAIVLAESLSSGIKESVNKRLDEYLEKVSDINGRIAKLDEFRDTLISTNLPLANNNEKR